MEIGELLGKGRSADVYALDDERVLRRYRLPLDARRESAVMEYVAQHGFPVPRVHPAERPATDLVMERLTGPTMLRALIDGEITIEEAGRTLGRLLRRLHEIPARLSADPADRILHLDLHPDNVLLTPRGPVVIDWCNTEEGPPALDHALSAVILAQEAVHPENELAAPARSVLAALLAELGDTVDTGEPMDRAAARRAANATLTKREIDLLDDAVALIRRLGAN
ncbi:phosphotransferase [Nonomuraea sp. K274]|uniref:Phosphotransferase n=1 Tax=Nonomuraea cypriaca TaxID=1187855 RepID=A0A931AMC1_9ACTN|nr:phosphotransferase [Nonomuraea cypriaca]MBF8192850.1 phosphotransferase [Nonomuraea cypriaca]